MPISHTRPDVGFPACRCWAVDPAQLPPIQGGGFFTEAKPYAQLHRGAIASAGQNRSSLCRWTSVLAKPLTEGQYG